MSCAPSPISPLAQGNSDSFELLPIKIGPEENDLISFYRDVVMLAKYDYSFRLSGLSRIRKSEWEDNRHGLHNHSIAHGSLARYGHIMSQHRPSFRRVAMEHHYQSTRLLLRSSADRTSTISTSSTTSTCCFRRRLSVAICLAP